MSEDRKTRRRFLADLLFAGGALTAASVLGYTATHPGAQTAAAGTPTPTPLPAETPATACTPSEIQPPGAAPPPPPRDVAPSGRVAPTRVPIQRTLPRDPMAPLEQQRGDIRPGGAPRPRKP